LLLGLLKFKLKIRIPCGPELKSIQIGMKRRLKPLKDQNDLKPQKLFI